MSTVIKVENISKQYRLGDVGTGALAHDVNKWWHKVRGKGNPYLKIGETNDRASKGESDYVWALKDINFEVKQGEVLGIIGRNGAGKSTLLKILSKTTTPTTGSIKIKGRIASLLEVGTGFHPELSGRDNIFLNGAILGMTRREIKSRFDEIVEFAGVERYIDTPVKRYSSGMYVRLAFGVAAHLEPEILIVDEVLAVGDAEFQKKALGKMKDVSQKDGRTVLFVSHNLAAISKLCNKGLLLSNGYIEYSGNIKATVDAYMNIGNSTNGEVLFKGNSNEYGSVTKVLIENEQGRIKNEISIGEKWIIKIYFEIYQNLENFISAVGIMNASGLSLNTSWQEPLNISPGLYCAEFEQNEIKYSAGLYSIVIGLSIGVNNFEYIDEAINFNIQHIEEEQDGAIVKYDSSTTAILNQLKMKTSKI